MFKKFDKIILTGDKEFLSKEFLSEDKYASICLLT